MTLGKSRAGEVGIRLKSNEMSKWRMEMVKYLLNLRVFGTVIGKVLQLQFLSQLQIGIGV